jgi:hypothetical protein
MNLRNSHCFLVAFLTPDVETRSMPKGIGADHLPRPAILLGGAMDFAVHIGLD